MTQNPSTDTASVNENSSENRSEVLEAERRIAENNAWYTADQIAGQRLGVYRHNMRLRYDYAARMVRRLSIALNGKTVVDLGCGDGQWSIEINRSHPQANLVGVDYNRLRLERYRNHVPGAETHFGSCLEIPLEDNSADVVMFHQVLEHIPDPAKALREVHRIIKPDGWLMLSVPNEGTWLKKRVQYRWIEPGAMQITDHVNFFTASTLRALLRANSFKVRRIDAMGFFFPHNGISRRLVTHKAIFQAGVLAAHVAPVLRDCLFAWCRPVKAVETRNG